MPGAVLIIRCFFRGGPLGRGGSARTRRWHRHQHTPGGEGILVGGGRQNTKREVLGVPRLGDPPHTLPHRLPRSCLGLFFWGGGGAHCEATGWTDKTDEDRRTDRQAPARRYLLGVPPRGGPVLAITVVVGVLVVLPGLLGVLGGGHGNGGGEKREMSPKRGCWEAGTLGTPPVPIVGDESINPPREEGPPPRSRVPPISRTPSNPASP